MTKEKKIFYKSKEYGLKQIEKISSNKGYSTIKTSELPKRKDLAYDVPINVPEGLITNTTLKKQWFKLRSGYIVRCIGVIVKKNSQRPTRCYEHHMSGYIQIGGVAVNSIDPYYPSAQGVGAHGIIPDELRDSMSDVFYRQAKSYWSTTLQRCYGDYINTVDRSVMSREWMIFENFLKDVVTLPGISDKLNRIDGVRFNVPRGLKECSINTLVFSSIDKIGKDDTIVTPWVVYDPYNGLYREFKRPDTMYHFLGISTNDFKGVTTASSSLQTKLYYYAKADEPITIAELNQNWVPIGRKELISIMGAETYTIKYNIGLKISRIVNAADTSTDNVWERLFGFRKKPKNNKKK